MELFNCKGRAYHSMPLWQLELFLKARLDNPDRREKSGVSTEQLEQLIKYKKAEQLINTE